jgi:hypothetical protein
MRQLHERNSDIAVLAQLFPDIKVEVFRELLVRFDGNSRLDVCVHELLRHKSEWVKGRWRDPDSATTTSASTGPGVPGGLTAQISDDELFRSEEYKQAVKTALSQEFRSLSGSTISGVLAEVNYAYIQARPTLQELSRKTWRATLGAFNPFRKKKKAQDGHPFLVWQQTTAGEEVPVMKKTGCAELDQELHDIFVFPILEKRREEQESLDLKAAEELNEAEARDAEALYECCCCLSDATFEQIATCSAASHVACFTCIQRTLHHAVFGQGWSRSVDPEKSTLRCLAPLQTGACDGSLGHAIVRRAVHAEKAGSELYRKFEDRLASDALLKSQLKLIRCPFCTYAEVDPVFHPPPEGIVWRFRSANLIHVIIAAIVLLDLIPLLLVSCLGFMLLYPLSVADMFAASLRKICIKTRNKRFACSNPSCRRLSCITCRKTWTDPHQCYEPLLLSLRNTIESARTAAIKRTCPRCGLSFVKSSGCNKLTCVCGYSMCYLCRKALGPRLQGETRQRRARAPAQVDGENGQDEYGLEDGAQEETEGYKHFCEHFRPNAGSRCTQCTKCDLYQVEDEDAVAQRAAEKAEREWRIRQGLLDSPLPTDLGAVHAGYCVPGAQSQRYRWKAPGGKWTLEGILRFWTRDVWRDGRWRAEVQGLVDQVVERLVVVVDV